MPFIENAFKYTQIDTDKSFVNISIKVVQNCPIYIKIENSKDNETLENRNIEHSGIGIKNATKRLELIYPNKHSLKIKETTETFSIILKINDL